ncbi:MAG: hypothetical protein ABSH16_04215 [Sedimentisphaerales bacterium]
MRRGLICLLLLIMATASNGFADVVIGDWEGVSDGWTDWNGGSDVALSTLPSKYDYSTSWSSLNATSLKVTQAGWNQNLTIRSYQSTNPNFVSEFLSHSRFSIDMHFEGSEWANSTWAQIYELAVNGTGVDWASYAMGAANESDTQNPTAPGQWGAPSSGTVSNYTTTVSWDYNAVKATMVTAGLTSSSGYVNFIFATNCSSSGYGSFYFDNARFENPIALSPSPADAVTGVGLTPTLSWTASSGTTSHDVYFGTDSSPAFVQNQAGTTYSPGTLENNTTYYWRIDEHNTGGTVTGTVWSFNTGNIFPLTIKKCTVTAGKTQASDANLGQDATDVNHIKDSFTASGTAVFPTSREDINHIDVNIISEDGNVIYNETIDFNDHNDVVLKHGKYSYSHKITKTDPNGAITSLKMDFTKDPNTFAIKATNINLTGLACPVQLELIIGDNIFLGEANEAIVNGKKLIPTRLMRMYQDTLLVTKAKAKHSTKPLSDSLSVTGEIAIEDINNTDMNKPNLAVRDVNFIWGDQTFAVHDGNFVAAKTGHKYTCKKIASDVNVGLVAATFDLDKCTFTMSVKGANNLETLPDYPDVNFSINYGIGDANDFNETADVNLVTRRSY